MALFGIDSRRLHYLEKIALGVGFVLSLVAFFISLRDVTRYAGIDFRNRIVGARVLLTGQNPFTFVWQPGMPLELLDPCHDDKVHRLTAPPPTLFLYAALAPLPYRIERLISFALEWLGLIASIAILARMIVDNRQRVLFLLAAIFFFVLSVFWRMHLERGQVYVFHLLALSAATSICLRRKLNSWMAGILFGIAALMRPNYLLIAPAFLILGRWKTGLGTTFIFLIGVLATLPLLHTQSWQSYLQVGDQYYLTLWAPERLPNRVPPAFEGPVEGVDFLQHLNDLTSTSFGVFYQIWQQAGYLPKVDLGVVSKAIMAFLVLNLLGLLFARRAALPPRLGLALILTVAFDTDFFLPHRWGYVDVMLLLPLALCWPYLWKNSVVGYISLAFVLTGLVGGLCLASHSLYYATVLRSWLVMGGLTGLAATFWLLPATLSMSGGPVQPPD